MRLIQSAIFLLLVVSLIETSVALPTFSEFIASFARIETEDTPTTTITCPATYDKDTTYSYLGWAPMSTYVDNIDPAECCLKCSADPLCTFWIHTDYNKLDNYITADDSSITNAIENANSGPNHPAPSMIMGGGTDIVRYSDSSNKNKNSNGRRDRTTLCTLVHTAENAYFHEGKSGVIAGRILAHFENHNSGPINNGNDGGGGGDDNSNYSSDDLFPTATMEPSPTPEPALPAIEVEPPSYTGTEHKLTFTVNLINRDGFGTIKGYSWVQLSGPIDVMLKDSSTVNLTHLVAGEYSFQITVTASIIETISEVVNVTILPRDNSFPTIVAPHKDIDLETIANQEGKVLIQADESFDEEDQNENSYPLRFHWEIDDKKSPDSGIIENPNSFGSVTLSGLRKTGFYFILLTVTDSDGHQSPTVFTVNYHAPRIPPPVASAGTNQTIILPVSTVLLNGSGSTAEAGIKSVIWTAELSNPAPTVLTNKSLTNWEVSNLVVPGTYSYKITVTDTLNYTSSAVVFVLVLDDKAPVADAGGDQTVSSLTEIIILNATKSYDDNTPSQKLSFLWEKQPESPAAGILIDSKTSIAKVTGFIAGIYTFKLTVTDESGKSSTDDVSITVQKDDRTGYMIEIRLDTSIDTFTTSHQESVREKLAILYGVEKSWVIVDNVREGSVILAFHIFNITSNTPIAALTAITSFRTLFKNGALNVGFPVISIEPYICDNTCSGHGKCDAVTKQCVCDAYWVENIVETLIFNGESNCGWSVVYVILVSGLIFLFLLFLGWFLFWWCCSRTCRGSKRRQTILDRRSKGDKFDQLELMPREAADKLMSEDGDDDEYDEEEDIFDSRYLTAGTKKPSAKSPQARMLRLNSSSSSSSLKIASPTKKQSDNSLADEDDKPFVNELAEAKQHKKPNATNGTSNGNILSKLKKTLTNGQSNGHKSNGTKSNGTKKELSLSRSNSWEDLTL